MKETGVSFIHFMFANVGISAVCDATGWGIPNADLYANYREIMLKTSRMYGAVGIINQKQFRPGFARSKSELAMN